MDNTRIAAIRARAQAASLGPWHPGHLHDDAVKCNCPWVTSEQYFGSICTIDVDNGKGIREGGNDSPPLEEAKANQVFIAHSRQDIPDLLKWIDHLTSIVHATVTSSKL